VTSFKAAKDGSTSRQMASGNKRAPTRWDSRRRQSGARWGSPTQTLVRCRWRSHEYVQRSSVSVRTGKCAVGRGEQRGSTPRVYGLAIVRTSQRGHGGDTKPTAHARRRHRDKSTMSRFRRGGVQGRSGQRFDLGVDGSTDTRAPVRWGSRRRHGGMSSTVTDR
jgi:hypothetical protein